MVKCASCLELFENFEILATHLLEQADKNSPGHIRFLNSNITKTKIDKRKLTERLEQYFDITGISLNLWIKKKFVEKFYSKTPHPFVVALQHPDLSTLLGYVVEHQHFLRQWVKSCAYVIAKTDYIDVAKYEIDNIATEFGGVPDHGIEPHYEFLLKMGESLGVPRKQVLETPPLPDTVIALEFWDEQAREGHWVETMAAMHSLELIAYRDIKDYGATLTYFDPQILESEEYTDPTKAFLREGYEADVGHADEALELVQKYSSQLGLVQEVQATVLKSMEMFDIYLLARLERGKDFE